MPLFCSCFAFLLVHSYTLTVTAALPVQVTSVTTQAHSSDIKPMRSPTELFHLTIGNPIPRHSTPSFKHIREEKSEEDDEKQEDFQPCVLSNKTYQHREQIPRTDPCEMCVCVDSEMYCFWKLCNLFNSTAFTSTPSTASISKHGTTKQSIHDNNVTVVRSNDATDSSANEIETTDEKFSKILKDQRKYNALKKLEATSPKNYEAEILKNHNDVTSTTDKPTVCYVMGVMYKYGEVLPRDTGTCLECACSEGGRVSCSPKDCVSQPDLDYLSHNNNLDMFDLDTF